MTRTLGETAALAAKAARGAGLSWGMAEEAGWAVRWLTARDLDGAGALLALLRGAPGVSALALGTRLSDEGRWEVRMPAGPVAAPLLLVPYLAAIVDADAGLRLDAGRAAWRIGHGGVAPGRPMPPFAVVRLARAAPPAHPLLASARARPVAPGTLAGLDRLAQRTYAPATEASRLKGAGAGIADTD